MINSLLADKITEAVNNCYENGEGRADVNKEIKINANWEDWDEDSKYSVMGIYIYENGIIKFYYQDVNTLVEQEDL